MSSVNELKAKLATLDKIISEAKAERRRADDVLGLWEERENRRNDRQKAKLNDVAERFPALRRS